MICRLRLEIFPTLNRITNGRGDSAAVTANANTKCPNRCYWLWNLHSIALTFFFIFICLDGQLFAQLNFQLTKWTMFTDRFTYLHLFLYFSLFLYQNAIACGKFHCRFSLELSLFIFLLPRCVFNICRTCRFERWNRNDNPVKNESENIVRCLNCNI